MELSNKIILIMFLLLLSAVLVIGATSKHFVDSDYNQNQILNVSNLTIAGRFSDGLIVIESGTIWNATQINSSEFYQGGSLVLTSASIENLSVNYSTYSNYSTYTNTALLENLSVNYSTYSLSLIHI